MRHPSWGPISVKSQNLVHKSEFCSLDAATGTTVTGTTVTGTTVTGTTVTGQRLVFNLE
jgi:hypothetical protein